MSRPGFTVARSAIRSAPIRQFPSRTTVRWQSTEAGRSADSSHAVAGLAGGVAVLAVGYGWYHFSGTKTVVNSARSVFHSAQQVKDQAVGATPSPKVALGYLRSAAKTYGAAIPGLGGIIDKTFDEFDELADKHGPEVQKTITKTYNELQDALTKGGEDVGDKVLTAIQKAMSELQSLSGVGLAALGPMLKDHPELKEKVDKAVDTLQKVAQEKGPEATKVVQQTYSEIRDILNKGLNPNTLSDITNLVQKKSDEITKFAASSSSEALNSLRSQAESLLDNLPDLRKLVDSYSSQIKTVVGDEGVKELKDTVDKVEKLKGKGWTDETKKEAQELVKEKFEEIKKNAPKAISSGGGSGDWASWAKAVPGVGKVLDESPDLKQLKELKDKHGGKFEELLESTYSDIKNVIKSKLEEGKKVSKEAAGDAKDAAKK